VDTRIEEFRPEHLEAVVALALRAWEPVFESIQESLEPEVYEAFYHPDWRAVQSQAVTAACTSEAHGTWVAVVGDEVVGFVDTVMCEDDLGEIHMIAVDPAQQRKGVGGLLIEHAIDRLREAGAVVAMVETGGDAGHAPARRLYERAGSCESPVARYFHRL
jgi:ribosomal protein S18 acetylase RimI-like enzyme